MGQNQNTILQIELETQKHKTLNLVMQEAVRRHRGRGTLGASAELGAEMDWGTTSERQPGNEMLVLGQSVHWAVFCCFPWNYLSDLLLCVKSGFLENNTVVDGCDADGSASRVALIRNHIPPAESQESPSQESPSKNLHASEGLRSRK